MHVCHARRQGVVYVHEIKFVCVRFGMSLCSSALHIALFDLLTHAQLTSQVHDCAE